mgnify:CR=1 FL=1
MKFKVDENIPEDALTLFVAQDLDVETVYTEELGGASDFELIEKCQQEKRALITLDLDFANIKNYPPEDYFGLIVLRVSRQDKNHISKILTSLLPNLESESVENNLWIVEDDRIRIYNQNT